MKILVISDYPRPSHPFIGIFNERSVAALKEFCETVEVMSPQPYVPPLLSLVPRWKQRIATGYELRDGISIYRPTYLQIPRLGSAFWNDQGAFFWCRQRARNMHDRARFDAIISFDLLGAGGIAWRIGRDLKIPASGWATGGDIRHSSPSSYKRALIRAIQQLNTVFYQSHELLEKAAELLGISASEMSHDRHVVLSRGIPLPPTLNRTRIRDQTREELRVTSDEILVLYVGSITRQKGIFELLDAISLAGEQDHRVVCALVGSLPFRDDTATIRNKLKQTPALSSRVRLLPGCSPDKVWEYRCAADIFAFPSHNEGMPNSLLEAMIMGVPSIAFAIPPMREIEAGTGALLLVPPLDSRLFAEAILRLARSSDDRIRIGEAGKAQVLDRFMVRKNMAEALRRLASVVEKWKSSKPSEEPHSAKEIPPSHPLNQRETGLGLRVSTS